MASSQWLGQHTLHASLLVYGQPPQEVQLAVFQTQHHTDSPSAVPCGTQPTQPQLPAYNPTPSTPGISKPHVGCHCSPAGALYRIQQSCPSPPGQHGTTLSTPVQPSRLLQTATPPRHMSVKLQQHQAKPCRKSCCSPCCTNYVGRTPPNDSRGTGVLAPAGVTGTHIGGGGGCFRHLHHPCGWLTPSCTKIPGHPAGSGPAGTQPPQPTGL